MRSPPLLRLLLLPVLMALACTPALPPRGSSGLRDLQFPLHTLRLPSGLQIVVEEDHRSPVVAVVTLVGAGSSADPAGKEGLAHLVEHLTFRARPDTRSTVWRQLEQLGAARFDAETSLDATVYYELAPARALPDLVRLEGTRLLSPLADLDEDAFALEREVVRDELRLRGELEIPGQIAGWMQESLFPARHPYAHALAGTGASLDALTLADAQAFASARYQPANATMVIIGDVDLKSVEQVVLNTVPPGLLAAAPAPAGPRLPPVPPEPPPPPEQPMARHQAPVNTPELWIGWTLPRGFDADHYLQQFTLQAARGELPRAFSRDDDILNLSLKVIPGEHASLLLCRVVLMEGRNPAGSADHVLDQLFRVWQPHPSSPGIFAEEVFFKGRWNRASTGLALEAEDLIERGRMRAGFTHFSGDPNLYTSGLDRIGKLAPSRVTEFAARYLGRDRARIVYVTPEVASPPPSARREVKPASPESLPTPPDRLAARDAARPPGASAFTRVTLPNGLELVIARRPGLPVAAVAALMHGGTAAAQPAGAEELVTFISEQGAHFNGRPFDYGLYVRELHEPDSATYVIEGGAGNVDVMIAMMAERLQTTRVDEGAEVNFRQFRVPVLKQAEAIPERRAERAFWAALYGDHAYGRVPSADDLENLTLQDARAWVDRTHVPKNTVIAIVGEIDPKAVEESARAWLGGWSAGDGAVEAPAPPAIAPGTQVVVTPRPGATRDGIALGCVLPAPDDKTAVRNELMAELLRDRLRILLHDQLGTAPSLAASAVALRGGAAHLLAQGSVESAALPRILAGLKEQTAALAQGRFEPGEVDRARWRAANAYATAYDASPRLALELVRLRNRGWPVESLDAYAERLSGLTEADLQRGFAACAGGRRVLSIVGDETAVQAALKGTWR